MSCFPPGSMALALDSAYFDEMYDGSRGVWSRLDLHFLFDWFCEACCLRRNSSAAISLRGIGDDTLMSYTIYHAFSFKGDTIESWNLNKEQSETMSEWVWIGGAGLSGRLGEHETVLVGLEDFIKRINLHITYNHRNSLTLPTNNTPPLTLPTSSRFR